MNSKYILTYPPFVTSKGFVSSSCTRILTICGTDYIAMLEDSFIEDAIDIAAEWPPEEINYERINHLQYWLCVNEVTGPKLPYSHIHNMQECKDFIENVIRSFESTRINYPLAYNECIQKNNEIFSHWGLQT